MKSKHLLLTLLMALLVPWAASAQTSLWSEDFEGGSMPTGWTTDGSGSWSVRVGDYSTSTGAGHGSYNAMITHSSTGNVTKLITPEIDLSTVASAELSFMHIQRSWAGDIDQLRVYYRTSSSGSWTQIAEYTAAFASWTTEDGIVLPDLSSTYQIAFEHTDNYGYGVGVDNIVIVQGASCPKPTGLTATANGQSATLTWIGDASSFHVAYSTDGTANPDDLTYTTVNTNSYTKDNLALDADHYFWVRANCSATEQSNWTTPTSVHIGYCVPAPSSVDGNGISNVTFGVDEYVVNNDTPKATYADYHTLIGAVQAGVESTIAITFATGYTYNTYVWVDLDNSLSFDADEVVCYGESTSANPTTLTLSFTIPADQTLGDFRLRIGSADSGLGTDPAAANPCYSSSYGCFQDYTLRVLEAPSCLPASDVAVGSITTNSAVINWTNNNGDEATYTVMQGENVLTTTAVNSYTLTGLTASSFYPAGTFTIVANCDENAVVNVPKFTTACGAVVDFPWSYDFENDAAGDFANPCWVNEHIAGSSTYVFYVYTSTMGSNSTHQLQLRDQSAGNMTKLVLPEMTLPGDNYQFVIDVYRSHYSTLKEGEGIRVFASTDGEIEGATELAFIPRQYTVGNDIIPAETVVGWYTYELPIGISGTCYIILRGESQYGTSTYMDNFAVMQAPTCMKPTNLTQTHTNHSATLSWTAGNEGQNAWQIAYSTTSFDPNAADFDLTTVEVIDNVDETSYTFDKTLDANTHYYMYVRGYCGDEDYSKWVGTNFTTGTANPSPTITSVDEITPVSAVLRWTAAGGDYLESYDIYYSQTSGEPANDSLIQYTGVDAGFTSKILENLTEGYWYVYMRAYHGETDGYSSWTPYYGYGFQVPEACPEPTNLTAGNPTPNSITLTWTEGAEWQYAWKVAYSTDPEFNPADTTSTYSIVEVFGQQGPEITCTVTGLDSETTYYFKVLGNCNSPYGDSDWTNAVSATTLVNCPVPTDLNVTVARTSATLNWTGYSDSYTVQYRTAGGYDVELVEGFESGSMPAGWTIEGDNQVSTKTWQVGVGDYSTATGTHSGDYNALIKHNSDGDETYLITPALDFSGVSEASLNLWYINRSWGGDIDEFGVYYRVNGGEWNELFSTTEAHSTWTELNLTLTGLAANTQIGFKCYDGYGYGIGLDDITILGGEYNEPGEWIAIENVEEETITIEGLEFGTKYDAQVKANCGEEYCDYITFTTNALKRFTTEGAWEVAANWTPAGAPTIDDVVSIEAPATISQIAYANEITVANGGSITIADGGQLVANSDVTNVTVEKDIVGYTVDNYETNNGYYFIANPTTTSLDPSEVENLINETVEHYDLYAWSTSYGQPWKNYKQNEFSTLEKVTLNTHDAYLYANMDDVTLKFNGTVISSQNRKGYSVYVNNNEFGAWNLVGNPFVCNAYLVYNDGYALPYYKMNADGNGYEATTGEAIAPATGIFYEAPASGQVYFTREAPVIIRNGVLNMNLRSNNKQLDNAIVRFGEGQQMSKFSFRENSTKIYIPMDGINYAVVNAGQAGEMPVSFKAESNGSYSLNFTSQEVSFSYLHLIDNMTGDDVNLLETPYYTFNAQTTDYANRFKLVFATGSSVDGDSFGFINGAGNLSIFGIEGEATVQVVDVLGHVLSSETFSGSYERKLNVAPGVYMVRLIQGNDVKVQKMVIK